MRLIFLTVVIFFAASMPTAARADSSPTILVVGDSLSAGYGLEIGAGWVDLLAHRLLREGYEHRVVNASITGDTTAGGLARLDSALAKHTPEIVVLELGGNDGLRGISLAVMRENFEGMIERSMAADAAVVLLGMRIPENYGRRYADGFHRIYGALATRYDLPWIEFFMDRIALDESLMQRDRIHPNEAAQAVLLDNAWPAIAEALTRVK